jgi:DNA repair ATPase RecN
MSDDARFDRLEAKIDKLTDAVTQIARVEEKILASNQRLDRAEDRISNLEEDLDAVASIARKNSSVAGFADKLFWLAMGIIASVASFTLRGD